MKTLREYLQYSLPPFTIFFFVLIVSRVFLLCLLFEWCRIYAKAIETFMYHRRPSERERHDSHVLVCEQLIHMLERQMEIASLSGVRRIRKKRRERERIFFVRLHLNSFFPYTTTSHKRDELIYMYDDEIKPRVHFIIYIVCSSYRE